MLALGEARLKKAISSIGLYNTKAANVIAMSRLLVEQHGGEVPASMDALVELPGVGRKTANVVLGHALGVPGFPVDLHVFRVGNRIGLIHTDDAVKAETALCALLPPERWTRASDTLILHGRRICRPTPMCDMCQVREGCEYFKKLGAKARPKAQPSAQPKSKSKTKPRPKPTKAAARFRRSPKGQGE
jgi:endonuclease-3